MCVSSRVFFRPLTPLSHSFSTDLFSVTGAQGCCHGGRGRVAGVWVGKATGVVYLLGLRFMCSPGGGGLGHWVPNLHLRLALLSIG